MATSDAIITQLTTLQQYTSIDIATSLETPLASISELFQHQLSEDGIFALTDLLLTFLSQNNIDDTVLSKYAQEIFEYIQIDGYTTENYDVNALTDILKSFHTHINIQYPSASKPKSKRGMLTEEAEKGTSKSKERIKPDIEIDSNYGIYNGVICRQPIAGKLVQEWEKELTPKVLKKIISYEASEGNEISYEVQILEDEPAIITREKLSTGKFVYRFPSLKSVMRPSRRLLYADVIEAIGATNEIEQYIGFSNCGVYYDKKTAQYFRLFPDGTLRFVGSVSPASILISPIQSPLSVEDWQKRHTYTKPSYHQQELDYTYFKKLTPYGETLLTIVHGVGTLLNWIHGNGYNHGYSFIFVAEQGSGKSTLSRIGISPLYPYIEAYNGNANADGTPTSIERILTRLNNTPSWVDDLHNSQNSSKINGEILNKNARAIFNHSPVRTRGKGSVNELQESNYLNTYTFFTAESLDEIEDSLRTRCMIVRLSPDYINKTSEDMFSLVYIDTHITSVYQWGDIIDTELLKRVNRDGYETVFNDLKERYHNYRTEIYARLVEMWKLEYSSEINNDVYRISYIGAYCYVVASIMEEVLHLPFLQDIKQCVLDSIFYQLTVTSKNKKINGVNAALSGILELCESVVNGGEINRQPYKFEALKEVSNPSFAHSKKRDAIPILYETQDYFLFPSSLTKIWLQTMSVQSIDLKSKTDKKKIGELSDMLEKDNLLAITYEKRHDYSKRIDGKQIWGLAIKKEAILQHFRDTEIPDGFFRDASLDVVPQIESEIA